MDESKLLEECITIKLTPLQTMLLSKTVNVTNSLLTFLIEGRCMYVEKITEDNLIAPEFEQTGHILIQSALTAMEELHTKVWENGSAEIGEDVPEEFYDVISIYTTVIEQIVFSFIKSLPERDN